MKNRFRVFLPVVLLVPLLAAALGGWAVVTVQDLPDYLVAGRPTTIRFAVRQHGQRLVGGLSPSVEARQGSQVVLVPAEASERSGYYSASFTIPRTGEWTITVRSGFGASELTLLPLSAREPGAQPVSFTPMERGRRLFFAKGCVVCHVQNAVGPRLAERTFDRDYLRQFLANPAIRSNGQTFPMPNLELSAAEIDALSGFLQSAPAIQALK